MSKEKPRTRSARRNQQNKKRKSGAWGWIRTILGIILILVAVGLLALDPIKNRMIEQGSAQNTVANLSREQIVSNEEAEVTYNWDDIDQLDAMSVLTDNVSASDLPVVGGIAMPEIDLNLPIHKGVSNAGMYLGAGTLYADQEMGVSNYSLASHHSVNEDLLFAPLMETQIGDTVYLTDLENIYEYKVTFNERVPATAVDLTYPTETPTVTLITCDYGLVDRVVVQGELVNEVAINDASADMLAAFNMAQTVTANAQ